MLRKISKILSPQVDEKEYERRLNEIGILLEENIRKEERILFEGIQMVVPKTELNNLIGKINAVKQDGCDI